MSVNLLRFLLIYLLFMRKTHGFGLVLVVALALLVSFTGSVSAQTEAVACPAGLICTPIANVISKDCPSGYVCIVNPAIIKPIVSTSSANACYRFSTNLGYKGVHESISVGTDVANLQKLLISKGFDIPSITKSNTPAGSFDEDTRNAVMKYQISKGISPTGFVGLLTRGSLNSLCLSDVSNSASIKFVNPIPSASPSNTATPMIYSINPSKGGLNTPIVLEGANFSAVTSLDLYASSGKWMGTLVPSQVSSNRITFSFSKAFTANTGSDTYQISAVSSNCKAGCNSNRVSYTLDNSASTPTPTISPIQTPNQPRVSFTYPVGSETWTVGDTKTVSWSYANFDSSVSGDKWVDLMLQPMDGREPVKLATYTAPYTSTPLKIYTKTSDGRNAWLPGQYKLKLVCRSTNIEGFRSCAESVPGYITIVQPSPTPTPTSEATIMQSTTGAELNASIWSAVEEYLKTR